MYMLRLAWKYVNARLINYVAILVVALTLMASIVVIGVMDGMMLDMERRIRDLGEQVLVSFTRPVATEALVNIKRTPGVKGFTPLIKNYALLKHGMITEPGVAFGIDLKEELKYSALSEHLENLDVDNDNPQWLPPYARDDGLPGIFLGVGLAEKLQLSAGDSVMLHFAPPGSETLRRKEFYVGSIFRSGSPLKDHNGFYLPIDEARKLFYNKADQGREGVDALSYFLHDPSGVDEELEREILREASKIINPGTRLWSTTWKKRWKSMYEGMAHENMLMEVVLFFMNFSAGFCVFAVLATLVSRRVRDVGLLRCLGAGRRNTVCIFIMVGLFIGVIGSVIGVVAGYLIGLNVDAIWMFFTGSHLYPPRMFGIASTPVIHAWKVGIYAGGAVFISLIAGLYPAIWAGCREPVEALKDE